MGRMNSRCEARIHFFALHDAIKTTIEKLGWMTKCGGEEPLLGNASGIKR
jgi:hypothetical protein